MDTKNSLKLQQRKLQLLIEQLNSLSRKQYYYQFKQDSHYLCFKIGYKPYTFRYFKSITDLIQLLENLVKYRMVEYEEPQEDANDYQI